jgi:hypothetical protein
MTNDSEDNWGPFLASSGLALYYVTGIDLRVARRASTQEPFGNVQVLTSLNTGDAEFEPTITADERTIFFARSTANRGLDVYVATRSSIDASFDEPQLVPELSSTSDDIPAWVSPDLCEIHVTQTNGAAGWDLFHAVKPD